MIKEFVDAYMAKKSELEAVFAAGHPPYYDDVVKAVVAILPGLDPSRVHEIDDGDYQGTLVYVVGAEGYQPSEYWYVFVGYGSCSGCDTLEGIREYSDEPPTPDQVAQYMTLALHIVQGLRAMG